MILIGLGGNLDSIFGSVEQTADKAFEFLEQEGVRIVSSSSWFKTAPVPISDQPWYKNKVFAVQTDKPPKDLLKTLLEVERKLGRVRSVKNAARVLDLDLLVYHQEVINDVPDLILPHPRMHLRAFVLYPLQQIAPLWEHPVLNKDISTLISELSPDQEIKAEL